MLEAKKKLVYPNLIHKEPGFVPYTAMPGRAGIYAFYLYFDIASLHRLLLFATGLEKFHLYGLVFGYIGCPECLVGLIVR